MSVGIKTVEENRYVTSDEFAAALAVGFKKSPLLKLTSFFDISKIINKTQLLQKTFTPIIFTLSSYLLISSGYLAYMQKTLQQQLTTQSNAVSEMLDKQVSLDNQVQRYQALLKFSETQGIVSPLWAVMAKYFTEVQFSNIRKVEDRFIIRGTTTNATIILESINNNPHVSEAKFDFPTRKTRKGDVFVISFILLKSINSLDMDGLEEMAFKGETELNTDTNSQLNNDDALTNRVN